jgi:hypothetical protein
MKITRWTALTSLLFPAIVLTSYAYAQTIAAPESSRSTMGAENRSPWVAVPADLTTSLDAKSAKLGDPVEARLTAEVRFSNGTVLPKGTRLIGKVTDVQARSKQNKISRLAFGLDHALLRDGSQIGLDATIAGLAGPAENLSGMDSMPVYTGSAKPAGGVAPSASLPQGVADSSQNASPRPLLNTPDPRQATDQSVAGQSTGAGSKVPLTNLPGVTCTSGGSGGAAATLNSDDRNVYLSRGSKMLIAISASH